MRFWDSSAVVTLLVDEPARPRVMDRLDQDPDLLVWWGTPVEVASALARRERERVLSAAEATAALEIVRELAADWHEVAPSDLVRRTAERLLRIHPLRAADSLQLAAALVAAGHDPVTLELVCLDERLAGVARLEGFAVLG